MNLHRRPLTLAAIVALFVLTVASVAGCEVQPPDTYVALGDSYTSGPGIADQVTEQVTPDGDIGSPAGCDRSDHNYPSLAEAALAAAGMGLNRFWDFSCSGATTADFTSAQTTGDGRNVPQLDAVGAGTKIVTIGIGGNDIGFVGIAQNCISLSDASGTVCKQDYVHGSDDVLRDRIDALAPKIAELIDEVHTRAPQAQIYIVGYPTLLPTTGWCRAAPIRDADGAYLRGIEDYLNQMLADQAQAQGAFFVDTATTSEGHDACAGSQAWVNGADGRPGDGILAHPNAAGMAHTAQLVAAAIEANAS